MKNKKRNLKCMGKLNAANELLLRAVLAEPIRYVKVSVYAKGRALMHLLKHGFVQRRKLGKGVEFIPTAKAWMYVH